MAISEKQLKEDYTEWSTKGHKFLRTSETGRVALRGKIPEEWFQSVMRQIHYNVHRDIDVDEYRVEAEHMAEVVKEMGRAVNTGFFIPYARNLDPNDKGKCWDFRTILACLAVDLIEMVGGD